MKLSKRFRKRLASARLAREVIGRRLRLLGPNSLLLNSIPAATRVVYLDAGLHREATQLRLVANWFGERCELRSYGFEANPVYFRDASRALRGVTRVSLVNAALVGCGHASYANLYLSGGTGVGDSLVRRQGRSITVPAIRLSDFLIREDIDVSHDIVILRMNIEGAETFVLEDLLATGLISYIDGFYGSWDDPHKIGGEIAMRLDAAVTQARIKNIRFNDKESRSKLQLALIRYDLITSIVAGARTKRSCGNVFRAAT
jgi:FkbM family methyltransferase